MPNGIYIQTEYHGKLIRKIVCQRGRTLVYRL